MAVICDCLSDILNVFLKNYVCSGPVWEYFQSKGEKGQWSEGLIEELKHDKINGFVGKTCIHPSQLEYVKKSNIVTLEQYNDAISILGASAGVTGVIKGQNGNKMNEIKPHTSWARKIVGQAAVYGVLKENLLFEDIV